jgi:hypothetical protein
MDLYRAFLVILLLPFLILAYLHTCQEVKKVRACTWLGHTGRDSVAPLGDMQSVFSPLNVTTRLHYM